MTSARIVALTLAGVALLGAARPAERTASVASSPESGAQAFADTLRYQIRPGEPLLVALPPQVGGRDATYSIVEAPSMSWLVDRSFYWKTLPSERGTLPIRFRRTAAYADTLVLLVEITN